MKINTTLKLLNTTSTCKEYKELNISMFLN